MVLARRLLLAVASLALVVRPAAACVGDLDGDGRVSVGELVRCVDSLLASASDPACDAAYPVLAIASLIRGVHNAIAGCPATPTPTMALTPSLTPTHEPSPTPSATPTSTFPLGTPTPTFPLGTPTPTFSWTPTPTRTSCVSEAPSIGAFPHQADPFLWRFTGYSRVLLNGRGSVVASLNCGDTFATNSLGSGTYEVDVALIHPGTNLVSICTAPAMCGTAYCRQRRIECGAAACVDEGDLPPVPRHDLSCQ